MQAPPIKIGMYYFKRMMTTKATPVVVTFVPGRLVITAEHQVMLDAWSQDLRFTAGKVAGTSTVIAPTGSFLLAALGPNHGPSFSPEQEAEIHAAHVVAAQDPQARQLELGRTFWVGRPNKVDGTHRGAWKSLRAKDAGNQKDIARIFNDALLAIGVQPA